MKKLGNKGFSLVELIIVIAIMAVLVGVMAPQLIKYIEQSKVTNDLELLNGLEVAFTYAIMDPSINDDSASLADVNRLISGPVELSTMDSSTKLYSTVIDTLGWNDLNKSTYLTYIKSDHTSAAEIWLTYNHDLKNPIKIWINTTDIDGKKGQYSATSVSDPNFQKCVHIN